MRTERSTPHRGTPVRTRLIAGGSVLAAAVAFAAPAASAEPPGPPGTAELAKASQAVLQTDVAGTAWHIDRQQRTLVVLVDTSVSRDEVAEIKEAVGNTASALRIEHTPGKLTKYVAGGDAVHTGGTRCSLGFNVRSGSTYYFLTAGHCTEGSTTWSSGSGDRLGSTAGSSFPGNDYGIVRYDSGVSHPGTAGSQDITTSAEATVGRSVQRRGSTTGVHGGSVTAVNATVNYGGGDIVRGLIRTNVCAEPGDSGGPLYSGSTALGLTSGGSGNCTSGGTTFFQPVPEVLDRYGVSVY